MDSGRFLHAWGQIILDAQGNKSFQVDGWEISTVEYTQQSGTIQRSGESATLQTEDGQWLAIPNLPADVPEGERVNVSGVILNGSLDWSFIDMGNIPGYFGYYLSCGGGGGGGDGTVPDSNFGGQSLAIVQLADSSQAPAQLGLPYQAGDTLDGQAGNVWVTIHQYTDHTETEAAMWVEAADRTVYVALLSGNRAGGSTVQCPAD
jgi:hypothetical protein